MFRIADSCGANSSLRRGEDVGTGSTRLHRNADGACFLWQDSSFVEVQELENVFGQADDGTAWVELDTFRNGNIVQSVDSAAGQSYQISDASSPRPNVASDTAGVEVYWNGQLIDTIARDGGPQLEWETRTIDVSGTGKATQLEFRAIGKSNGLGALIDNVKLQQVIPANLVAKDVV